MVWWATLDSGSFVYTCIQNIFTECPDILCEAWWQSLLDTEKENSPLSQLHVAGEYRSSIDLVLA